MSAVGLDPTDAHPELPPQVASTGLPHLLAPVSGEEALGRARPDYGAIEALLRPFDLTVLYLAFCPTPVPGSVARARARAFSAIAELGEDPATGSAAGPLCAYLHRRTGSDAIRIEQGVEMGRPSVLETAVEGDLVRVGGGVIPVIDGTVELPR